MKLTLGGLTSSEPDEDQVRLQLDVLLAESLATAQSMLGVDLITIFLLDQHQHLRPLHSTDLPLLWKVRRSTDAIVDKCFRQCETINVKDILKFRTFGPRFRPQLDQALGYRTKSMLCVPLVTGTDTAEPAPSGRGPSKALGVIQFTNKMRAGFEQLDPADDLTVKLNAQFEEESETIVVRHGASGTAHVIDVTKFTSHDVDMAESLARAVAPVLALHRQHVLVSLVKTPTLTPGGNTKENDAHREDVRTRYLNAATALLTNVWANVLRRADEPSHDTVQSGLRRYRDRAAAAKNFRIQGVLRASRKLLQLAGDEEAKSEAECGNDRRSILALSRGQSSRACRSPAASIGAVPRVIRRGEGPAGATSPGRVGVRAKATPATARPPSENFAARARAVRSEAVGVRMATTHDAGAPDSASSRRPSPIRGCDAQRCARRASREAPRRAQRHRDRFHRDPCCVGRNESRGASSSACSEVRRTGGKQLRGIE